MGFIFFSVKERLPLPGAIHSMFSDKGQVMDNPAEHGGRIRSFPHLEGNWASYVYIPGLNSLMEYCI